MHSGFKVILMTLPLVAAGVGILAYTIKTKAPPAQIEQVERATTVRVVTAAEGAVAPVVIGHGLVAPSRTFEAIAQVGGTIVWTHPDLVKGAVLAADTVLLRIADEDYRLAVAQAEANIRAAEAKLAELAVSQQNQNAALAIETDVLALKEADLARAEALHAGGTVAQSTLDAARAAHLGQRQKVQSIASALALIPTQLTVQQEQIAVSQAALATARLNLERTALVLPFTARVASTSVEPGRFVRAGEVTAMFDGVATAQVEAQVSVAELRRFLRLSAPDAAAYAADPTTITAVLQGLDLTADVRLDLGDEDLTWSARVDRVSDTIDPKTGTLGLIVVVDGAYSGASPGDRPPLTKGMFVEVAVSGKPQSGIVLPRHALREGVVLVVDGDDRLVERPVVSPLVQDEIAVVTEGLAVGERIVVSDPAVVLPGMLLAPVEDTELEAELEAMR